MNKAASVILVSALFPLSAFASGEKLVTAFETYCLKQTQNMLVLDKPISEKTDRHPAGPDVLRDKTDAGYFMSSGGRKYLIEWNGNACRVSTEGVRPNDVLKALASNHILSVPHGDNTDFGRVHWFEADHALTRYAFTHDLNDTTILLEYQQADATGSGPVAITYFR